MKFTMRHGEAEHGAIFLGQKIPSPEFINFEDCMYVPCRALIKESFLQHWERWKDFYFWHKAMTRADT